MKITLNDLYYIYQHLGRTLIKKSIGLKNALNLYDFIADLTKALDDVNTFIKENTEVINGEKKFSDENQKKFNELLKKETEFDSKLVLIETEQLDKNVNMYDIEPLLYKDLLKIEKSN